MRYLILCLPMLVIGCANLGAVAARQRAEAATDVPEDHPHPPARIVSSPADPGGPLRCWNNGEDQVCNRTGR